jgi:predicted alpha/beta-fold hydrolase
MLKQRAHGHAWTIGPHLGHLLRRQSAQAFSAFSTTVPGPARPVTISGKLSEVAGASTLLIVLHGCGGTPDSFYCVQTARFFHARGISVLRLAWRGADMSGEDFYHAGQTAELHAAVVRARELGYERIWVVGFSLGGHACLRFASESPDPHVSAIAAVCPVLDLPASSLAIDAPARALYRFYTLRGLTDMYKRVAARGNAPTPLAEVAKVRTFRAYDALTVVPRYGFRNVDDYYESQSVQNVLHEIDRPTLIIAARNDPMLPSAIAESSLRRLSRATTFRWAERGGHCFFPAELELGERAPTGFESQLYAWLTRH